VTPLERAEIFAIQFRGQANHLAFLYGAPLYLVGSYLHAETPGDIDIRCLIEREDLDLWFGEDCDGSSVDWTPGQLARCREELKVSRRMTRRWKPGDITRHRIDFQFQTCLFSDATGDPVQDDRPRIRLDAVPIEMLRAGRGEP
jgi:hypothetical protein